MAAHKRLKRRAQAREFIGQALLEGRLRILRAHNAAALLEHKALRRCADDDVGNQRGKIHIVGPDREQQHVERALRLRLVRLVQETLQLRKLGRCQS